MQIKKILLRVLKIMACVVILFVLLVVGAVWIINKPSVQNRILSRATEMLQEKLQTKVTIDSIRIGFFNDDVQLFHLLVEDQEHRPMLKLEYLGAEIDMWALLHKEVMLQEVSIKGLHAQLYKSATDSVANYQFVIDAFKPAKKKPQDQQDTVPKKKLMFDLVRLYIEDVDVIYNDTHASLGLLTLKKGWRGSMSGEVRQIAGSWVHIKKKDSTRVDNQMLIDVLTYEEDEGKHMLSIDSLHWTTDNHLPHKRTGKPKRGWFDDGHMNVVAHLKASVHHISNDSICGTLSECEVNDIASGFHITNFHCLFRQQAEKVYVNNVTVAMKNTTLTFNQGEIQLPSKKKGRPLLFSTSTITGTTQLTDISHPFAPVLKNFKIPLWLSTGFSGTDSTLVFSNVLVKTADNTLQIKAEGGIEGLKDKYKLNVHFDVQEMKTPVGTAERIINQFTVRKFMMKQLRALQTIRYTGSFRVVWKKEEFKGTISTNCGALNFWLALDEKNKYLNGNVQTKSFNLGKAIDYPDIGIIGCRAGFQFDYSKPRTAQMRRIKGGKLPIGKVDAIVYEAIYKHVSVTDIYANIVSDGAIAEGKIKMKGALADILCSFSFTDTDEMRKTKIKPGIRFHLFGSQNDDDGDKAARQKRKEERKQRKAEKKAQRKAAKEKEREARRKQKEKNK